MKSISLKSVKHIVSKLYDIDQNTVYVKLKLNMIRNVEILEQPFCKF